MTRTVMLAIMSGFAMAAAAQAEILKREPDMGMLKPGEIAYVDDGKCPKGQIKLVTGGDHIKVGGRHMVERQCKCVSRPPG